MLTYFVESNHFIIWDGLLAMKVKVALHLISNEGKLPDDFSIVHSIQLDVSWEMIALFFVKLTCIATLWDTICSKLVAGFRRLTKVVCMWYYTASKKPGLFILTPVVARTNSPAKAAAYSWKNVNIKGLVDLKCMEWLYHKSCVPSFALINIQQDRSTQQ